MTPSEVDRASSENGQPLSKMSGRPTSEQSCTPAMKHQHMMLVSHSERISPHKFYFVSSSHIEISTLWQSALSSSLSCDVCSYRIYVNSSYNLTCTYLFTLTVCHVISSLDVFNSDDPHEAYCCSHMTLPTSPHLTHLYSPTTLPTPPHLTHLYSPQLLQHHNISLTLAHPQHVSHHLTHIHNRQFYSFSTAQCTFKQQLTQTVQPHLHWRHVWGGPWKLKQAVDVRYHAYCIQDTALLHRGLLSDTAPADCAARGFCGRRKFKTFHVNHIVTRLVKHNPQQNWHWEMNQTEDRSSL